MNIAALQTALTAAGYPCASDGTFGPVTYGALLSYAAQRQLGQFGQDLGAGMVANLAAHGITSDLGLVHWTAQTCHETEGYRYLTELGGPGYFAQYDGRADLGNTQPGDGFRFRGRGAIQITGRWNYQHFGQEIGQDLIDNPDLAATPAVAVAIACQFWQERGVEVLADADNIEGVTHKINGGLNGLADRQAITARLKRVCGLG